MIGQACLDAVTYWRIDRSIRLSGTYISRTSWVKSCGTVPAPLLPSPLLQDGELILQDMFASDYDTPTLDERQDKELLMASQDATKGLTSFIFTMPISDCHDPAMDTPIYPDRTSYVTWALGDPDDDTMALEYHGARKGSTMLPLLVDLDTWKALYSPLAFPPDIQTFDIVVPKVPVTNADTHYVCMFVEPPADDKYHIYSAKVVHDPALDDNLHHIGLYSTPVLPTDHTVGKVEGGSP